jgi:hypothetical protein
VVESTIDGEPRSSSDEAEYDRTDPSGHAFVGIESRDEKGIRLHFTGFGGNRVRKVPRE